MSATSQAPSSDRLMSLDVFRGATMAAMLLVNNPGNWGAIYGPLGHAQWHGWTFTDLIFPFFLWIVGVAVPLSLGRRLEAGEPKDKIMLKILRRSLILFALGLFLNGFAYLIHLPLWSDGIVTPLTGPAPQTFADKLACWWSDLTTNLRVLGVLQRIAICYLFATMIYINTSIRGQVIAITALLLSYWMVMVGGPALLGWGTDAIYNEKGNFSAWVDHWILGTHAYKGTRPYDPEGIISTLPAIASTLFGIMTGHVLRLKRSPEEKTAWLFVAGNILLFAGCVLNFWQPINKKLWTCSYSVFMAGMAMNIFALSYWLVDIKGHRTWAKPFAIYGMNAITVFVLTGILGRLSLDIKWTAQNGTPVALKTWLYEHLAGTLQTICPPCATPENKSLSYALIYVLGMYVVALVMYRKKWFVRF